MAAVVPPPPPPPPIVSPVPPSDDDDDDDKSSSESSYSESDSDATPIPSSIPVPPPPPPAPASEPVMSADVAVDDAPAPAKDDRKLWERPWSLKELKNATECWTLAADAGLLLFMKEFSQKVVSKTHEIEKQVDSLIHEAKNTDTRAGNIFNDFMMLSNIQFVENRVYEENEDDDERQDKEEGDKGQSEERPAEEKQMEVVSRIREAVSCGLKVLDEAFTKLEVQDEASSDEDEEETLPGYHEPILEAKDPYALRPMPYLIGTAGFFESEDVGIGDFGSEDEEEEEEEEEYSTDEEEEPQARQQTRGLYEDDSSEELFEPSDRESEEDEKRGGVAEPFSGDSSSSDEGSSSSGEFSSEDDEGGPKKPPMIAPAQMGLQAELAARLGVTPAAPVTTTTGEASEFESSIAPSESVSAVAGEKHGKKKKKKKKHKDKGVIEDNENSASKSRDAGPFMPDEDEDEGTPFGQDSIFGTSTTAKGLFDESDEEKESSGGFAAAISGKKSTEEPSEDADKESLHSSMSKTSKKKLPAGAVPLFGSSGLFTPEEEKSVTFDDASTVKSEASPLIAKKKSASSLFDNEDDDEDEGGLFSTKKKPSSGSKASPTTAPKPRRHKSSTSSDVFDDKDSSGLFSSDQPQEGTAGSPARKKKPVGGVSVFGPQSSLFTDSMKASKSSFGEDDSEATGLIAEDFSVVSQPVMTSTVKTAPTTTTSSSGGMGLFDDSGGEEDLFAALSTQKSKPKGKPPIGGVSIFGGVTDELMDGTASTAPESPSITAAPVVAPTKPVTSTVTSKKSGGLFSDGTESDEDGLFSTKPTTTAAPKTTSTEAAKPTSSASKDPFGLGSDEDDSLFSSAPTVTKPPPSVQPVKAEEPKAVSKPKSKGSKDIFSLSGDDDNLFASALTSKPKSAEKKHSTKTEQKTSTSSISSVKKKPVARLGGLFDNDEDDDELFGSSTYGFGLGSSKPSTTKTSEPAKSSKPDLDLLSDNQSEDDGLFTAKPSSTAKQPKESVPPPTAPKTKQTTATDDLFSAPIDSGNVGGEPTQSSSDVVTEPAKPQKKKPAGAVPMFGGVDLFGGGGGGAGIKDTVPATTAAPSMEEKQENVTTTAPVETKKSFGGLFGSPTSEDDGIFTFKPKKAPVKTPVSQPQPEQKDDLFGPVKPSKLKSTVSFEAPTMKSPPTKAPTVEKSVSFEEPQKVDTLTNLTKNRAARQGGRRPPSRQAIKTRSSQSDDVLAGFTTDTPTSSTPNTSSKQFNAEPLGFSGAGSKPDADDDLFAASSTVLTPAGGSRSTTRKAKKPVARPKATKEPTDITKDILFGNDDMLAESPPKVTATIVDQKRVTEIEKQIEKEIQEDDDLFGTKVLSKKVTSTIDDELFGNPTSKSTVPSITTKSVSTALKMDDDDDDELFPSDNKKKPVLSSAATVTTSVLNKDDTDGPPPPPPPPHKLEGENDDELFPSDDKKKAKKVVKKKKPPVTDEDLFGNTDDIFGNVPKDASKPATGKATKAKTGKGKKKKKTSSAKAAAAEVTATTTTEPVTDVHDGETPAAKPQPSTTETSAPTKDNDFEDSLFGEAVDDLKKAKAMKKKAKKKSEPKDYSIFDTDAPSIFDDPLNADK